MKTVVILLAVALVLALIVVCLLYVAFGQLNELNREDCGNCKFYDKTLHTCWPRFEERFPGDKACDFYN